MADYDFENPTFDPDGPGIDDDYMADTPMEPPLDVQRELDVHGNRIQVLWEELKQTALEDQKKRLVDAFYNEVSRRLRPKGSIDYDQFGIDPDGRTLLWTPGDKKIAITATRGRFRFLALST